MRKWQLSDLFPLLLMLALAGASLWLEHAVQVPVHDKSGKTRHDPDFIADGFGVTKLGANGRPEYTLSAKRMLHFPDDDSTTVDAPRLVQRRENASPVIIRADRGVISKDGEEARFFGNVVVVREASPEHDELHLQTDFLQIVPDRDTVSTDRPVIVTEGRSRFSGVGMQFNNKTRQFELQSRVRGTFDARK